MKNSIDQSPASVTGKHPLIPSLAGAIEKVNFLQ